MPSLEAMTHAEPRGAGKTYAVVVYNTSCNDARLLRSLHFFGHDDRVHVITIAGEHPLVHGSVARVFHVPIRLPSRSGALAYLWFLSKALLAILRISPAGLYLHDYYTAPIGWLLCRVLGLRFAYDVHEIIYDDRRTLRLRLFRSMESRCIRYATALVAPNRERSRLLATHYGLPVPPVVIRNLADPRGHELARRRGPPPLAGAARLVYAGTIDERQLETVVRAMIELPRCTLTMLGDGPSRPGLQRLSRRLGLQERVQHLPPVPYERLIARLATFDVGIVCYGTQGANNLTCAPNKVFEYAQAGIPMVATAHGPLQHLLNAFDVGVAIGSTAVLAPFDVGDFVEAVQVVVRDWQRYRAGAQALAERSLEWWKKDEDAGRAVVGKL